MVLSEMRSRLILPLAVCLAGPAPTFSGQNIIQYSQKELHDMVREAKSPDDYQKLADYFRSQQRLFKAKAQAEFEEFARCSRYLNAYPKFPTRADAARQLFSYYSAKADRMARTAEQYEPEQSGQLDVVVERELIRVRP